MKLARFTLLLILSFTLIGCASLSAKKLAKGPVHSFDEIAWKANQAVENLNFSSQKESSDQTEKQWWLAFIPRAMVILAGGLLLKNIINLEKT